VFDTIAGTRLLHTAAASAPTFDACLSDDGSRIAVCGQSPVVRVFDGRSLELIGELTTTEFRIRLVRCSPDGKLLLTGGDQGAHLSARVNASSCTAVAPASRM
jgi:WD40 repeat protein